MLGVFQQSELRIELDAPESAIRDSLLRPEQFRQWLGPQQFKQDLGDRLEPGVEFTGWLGPIAIRHQVEQVDPNSLRLILSQGVDGFHQWYWGDGWVQSSLQGISLLPLNLGQTLSLLRLRQYLTRYQS